MSYRICTFVFRVFIICVIAICYRFRPGSSRTSRPLSPTKFLGQTHAVFHSNLDLHPVTSTRCSSLSAGLLLRRDEKGNTLSVLALPRARAFFSLFQCNSSSVFDLLLEKERKINEKNQIKSNQVPRLETREVLHSLLFLWIFLGFEEIGKILFVRREKEGLCFHTRF